MGPAFAQILEIVEVWLHRSKLVLKVVQWRQKVQKTYLLYFVFVFNFRLRVLRINKILTVSFILSVKTIDTVKCSYVTVTEYFTSIMKRLYMNR